MISSFGASCYAFYYGLWFALLKKLLLCLFQNKFRKGYMKLEKAIGKTRSWKLRNEIEKNEVGKFESKLENVWLFNTALKTFQLWSVLSNLNWNFLTSNLKLSNLSFFPITLFNYMYPFRRPRWKSRRLRVNLRQTDCTYFETDFPTSGDWNQKITVSFSSSNTFSKNYL